MQSLITLGKVKEFAEQHGYYYSVKGAVVRNDGRGSTMGFPTANIVISGSETPLRGVYVVKVGIGSDIYNGIANIGYAPTFGRNEFFAEVHIFGFNQDIYGQQIEILFVDFLREERKFGSAEQLAGQIRKDCERAREILKAA